MAINFKKIAKSATVLSDIMESRAKVTKKTGTVTIEDFDLVVSPKGEQYAICAINDTEFINGGFVLTKIFNEFVAACDGDLTEAREQFRNSGGLKVKLSKEETQSGHSITKVEVLD